MIGSLPADDLECPANLLERLTSAEKGQSEARFRGTKTRLVTEARQRATDPMRYAVEHAAMLTQAERQALVDECLRTVDALGQLS
ncbi:hypothetical protein [Azospirillum brasilense]|uniref:hypothetical protein n=1 Tax=Azospirillum brasilense TaxID=192 RepID=UPI000E676DAC|nr:hypothetical protein [Azospirillum brasilense]NUB23348.1 hypothetical protein [Azospirillum brasilense]NUB30970.1 hypothetical protein [Azospirillum brasilense]